MSRNDHTGDEQKTKVPTEEYREGWDRIFSPKLKKRKKKVDFQEQLAGEDAATKYTGWFIENPTKNNL